MLSGTYKKSHLFSVVAPVCSSKAPVYCYLQRVIKRTLFLVGYELPKPSSMFLELIQ